MIDNTPALFDKIGKALPDRQRIPRSSSMKIKIEPTGGITLNRVLDTFLEGKVDASKNNLEGKKLVLFFGTWSHQLTRTFYLPKLHAIYHYMTLARDDVEFLYVSLDATEQDLAQIKSKMPWPCVPYHDYVMRSNLEKKYCVHLMKKNGAPALVVLHSDHTTIINRDAEPFVCRTHDETGKNFPWLVGTADNCCAAASSGMILCNIL